MSKDKKLFNSEDFDKGKPLFGPEDFDKNPPIPPPPPPFPIGKIIAILAVVAVIVGGIFYFISNNGDKGNGNPSTEAIAQKGEKQDANKDTTMTETENNKDSVSGVPDSNSEASASGGVEDCPSVKESTTSPSAPDNKYGAEQSERPVTESRATSNTLQRGDVEASARRVIRGDFGNGQVRKDRLGTAYIEIQGKVNEMYRQGLVY